VAGLAAVHDVVALHFGTLFPAQHGSSKSRKLQRNRN
jgi:hypothetical protein